MIKIFKKSHSNIETIYFYYNISDIVAVNDDTNYLYWNNSVIAIHDYEYTSKWLVLDIKHIPLEKMYEILCYKLGT